MAPSTSVNDIKLEDIDFPAVQECTDKRVLKKYIRLLEDDGSYFVDLLKACKERLRDVAPKEYYLLYPLGASQSEVDEVTQDLLDWEAAVQQTDDALRKSKNDVIWDDPTARVRAPVRGQEAVLARPSLPPADTRASKAHKQPAQEKDYYARDKTNMKEYYKAWDHIDVDKIEEDMEKEEKEHEESKRRHFEEMQDKQKEAQAFSSIDVGDVAGSVPEAHRKYMADTEKEKGNEAFYAKDYEEAEAYYSRSLNFCAEDPSTWANRALVRLKLEKPGAALEDCDSSLALNPRYMKALHRKGKALHELQQYVEAVKCFQAALAQSPGNTQINGDLMMARRKLRGAGYPAEDEPQAHGGGALPEGGARHQAGGTSVKAAPEPEYTRVQIEEDSDSDGEVQIEELAGGTVAGDAALGARAGAGGTPAADRGALAAAGTPCSSSVPTTAGKPFHTVQIVEVDDDEEDDEELPVLSQAGAPGPADPVGADSDRHGAQNLDERGSVVGVVAPTPLAPTLCFNDMD